MSRAEEVANAVLYEGYILYPYRPSSVKNQQRWNFGVVYPAGSREGSATMETQCLVNGASAAIDIQVRFLHLLARTGKSDHSWQEGVEREVLLSGCRLDDLIAQSTRHEFTFPASLTIDGGISREQQCISGSIEVSAEEAGDHLLRVTICLRNLTDHEQNTRDEALLRSLVSAHKILTLHGGEFVSLIDPPACYADAAESCRNIGTFPVLAGEEPQRNVMLSSPIILYDYPQIAPESAGDLCDGTEIDEILSLRILTLTDEEKREMRESDERGRRILERTEAMEEEQWMKLHGVLRGLRPNPEVIQ